MELLVEQLNRRATEIGRWLEAEVGAPAEVRNVRLAVGGDRREPTEWPCCLTASTATAST